MALAARHRSAGIELGHRFRDVELLHSGAHFTIYTAREIRPDRAVAIKVPADSAATWVNDVIEHEATTLRTIGSHPNIVSLLRRIHLDDNRPALLLQRCVGTLADGLHNGGRMSLQDTLRTGIKLAGALESVHRAGVLHCDVRPNNVLVSEEGEPVLSGFDEAVAMVADPARPPLHITTQHTAPEVLEGGAPTPRSDVYGLASTLYELIAGRAAFRAYAGESPAAVIVRVLSGTVAPIIADGVPLEMSDLLTWAMAPDPINRPPGPAWLAEELGRLEIGQGWARTKLVTA